MSSIMRARSGLTGRGEVSEVIGLFSRAEGCWTFDARDRMPRPSRAIAHYPVDNPPTAMRSPSRASGFVLRRNLAAWTRPGEGPESTQTQPFVRVVPNGGSGFETWRRRFSQIFWVLPSLIRLSRQPSAGFLMTSTKLVGLFA